MNSTWKSRTAFALLLGAVVAAASSGCQSNVGGQTLPSAYYLRDDVEYFPAGPEFQFSKEVRAMEEYKAAQSEFEAPNAP